jgi:hypothetical protein
MILLAIGLILIAFGLIIIIWPGNCIDRDDRSYPQTEEKKESTSCTKTKGGRNHHDRTVTNSRWLRFRNSASNDANHASDNADMADLI